METERTGIFLTEEEMSSLRLIQNQLSCASQAADPRNIPDGCPEDKAKVFVKAALEAKADALFLEQDWWNVIVAEHSMQGKHVHIDFGNNELLFVKDCKEEK
jgi:hypothetical protein